MLAVNIVIKTLMVTVLACIRLLTLPNGQESQSDSQQFKSVSHSVSNLRQLVS